MKQMISVGLVAIVIAVASGASGASDEDGCTKRASPSAAIEACSKVLATHPEASDEEQALLIRGRAFTRKGMNDEAAKDFTAVLARSPSNKEALVGRAESYLAARAFDRAKADFFAIIAQSPTDISALIGLGYAQLATDQAELAIETLSAALERAPQNGVALNNRGLAYKKLGKLDLAIRDFTTAVQFSPLYGLAYNNRAYVYEAKGDKQRAVRDFRNALAIDPSLAGARDGLVRLGASGSFAAEASKRVAAGQMVAEKNCAWCHAVGAKGESPNSQAPAFRDIHARHPILALRTPITRAIATPHDRMPKLPLSESEIDSIIAYINSLPTAQ